MADVSIASLSAAQAAGTAAIRPANPMRDVIMINPPIDCTLTLAPGVTTGMPLFGGVPNSFEGQLCPSNALYIVGLGAGVAVSIWEIA
ncbi:MAG: hypothetical protein ABIO86_17225 [Sphingomonas sp.]